ncbi:MAG: hypothetical protein AB3X37_10420 [Leptothrix ochracea]|uniref:hypothetical protein n=1 Tax=Leptothrix ochracea TaxID=735331 RepID=UPI0034E2C5A7
MVNISALMKALPVSGLEPQELATLTGFLDLPEHQRWQGHITLLEPPSGQRVPYINPVAALIILLRHQGMAADEAPAHARALVKELRADMPDVPTARFLDDLKPDSPECLPAATFVEALKKEGLISEAVAEFLEKSIGVAASVPMFRGPDNWTSPWSLLELPEWPPSTAMIEFTPGAPWIDIDRWGTKEDWPSDENPFIQWRKAISPIAQALGQALGESVYHFADLHNELDDDYVHRFLVLHWCCSHKPDATFVKHLVTISGARDVDELKAALIDPASYTHPYKMNGASGLETLPCRISYLPPGARKTVGVVFSSPEARPVAQAILATQISADAHIVAPQDLASADWIRQAAINCPRWCTAYMQGQSVDHPIDTLALLDELILITGDTAASKGRDLHLHESVEDLLWLALENGIAVQCLSIHRLRYASLEDYLKPCGAPERIAAKQVLRTAFTRRLNELRVNSEEHGTGLWDAVGAKLTYDQLDLTFALVRRIAAWQRDHDENIQTHTYGPPGSFWTEHRREQWQITKELQAELGPSVAVKAMVDGEWTAAQDLPRW